MTQENSPKRNWFATAAALTLSPIVIAGALVAYELSAAPDASIVVAMYEKLGHGEAAAFEAVTEAEAAYSRRMGIATEEVKAVLQSYSRMYDTLGNLAQRAADLEYEVGRIQAKSIDDSSWVMKVGTNVAEGACLLSMLSNDPSLREACDASRSLREGLVERYEVLSEYRPDYVSTVMQRFPAPSEILSEDFERLRSEFEDTDQ